MNIRTIMNKPHMEASRAPRCSSSRTCHSQLSWRSTSVTNCTLETGSCWSHCRSWTSTLAAERWTWMSYAKRLRKKNRWCLQGHGGTVGTAFGAKSQKTGFQTLRKNITFCTIFHTFFLAFFTFYTHRYSDLYVNNIILYLDSYTTSAFLPD